MTIGTMTWRNKSIRQISIIRRDVLIAILENSKKEYKKEEKRLTQHAQTIKTTFSLIIKARLMQREEH